MKSPAMAHAAFTEMDRWFADLISRLAPSSSTEVLLAASLVSYQRREGHTCLDLARLAGTLFPPGADTGSEDRMRMPELKAWVAALKSSPVVGRPGDFRPLILDGGQRLYLHRYWTYESQLATAILRRAGGGITFDAARLEEGLERFFGGPSSEPDQQRRAAAAAVRHRLCVISGGPGTGKTRTAAVVLALLLEQAGESPLRIALAAPTGKAAAHLQESIKRLKDSLPCAEVVRDQLPTEAFTLHRLLGSRPDSADCRFNAENPLPFDIVVVDEASMVDLALMAKLFAATPDHARLVLLGDRNQLASVEAGAVLAEICADEVPSLSGCIVQLQKNYRFGANHGLLALSQAINDGDADRALGLLTAQTGEARPAKQRELPGIGASGFFTQREGIASAPLPPAAQLKERLRPRVVSGFAAAVQARDPLLALGVLNRFRILSAVRQGPFGVENLNRLVEEILHEARLISSRERWYAGRPVMVTRNDYDLKLFNGDVGIVLPDPATGELRAWFPGAENMPREMSPARLPEHETAFATTVHKSQGSEFEEVLFILPDRESPVLSRELLYTGMTRCSRGVEVWFNETVFRAAVARRVDRASGLQEKLREATGQ